MVDNHESFAEFLWKVSEANLETNALHEFEKTNNWLMFFNNVSLRYKVSCLELINSQKIPSRFVKVYHRLKSANWNLKKDGECPKILVNSLGPPAAYYRKQKSRFA